MNRLKKIVSEAQLGENAEVRMWARAFAGWETDEVGYNTYFFRRIM